jgi:hypothetical protein
VIAAASSLAPIDPQAPADPQASVHVTAVLPPVTPFGKIAAAATVADAFTAKDPGGADTNTTPVGPDGTGAASSAEPPHPASNTAKTKEMSRYLKNMSSLILTLSW